MQRVMVSSCLLGRPVRYAGDAEACDHPALLRWTADGRIITFCPEVAGGLPTPRPPAEIQEAAGGPRVLRGQARVVDALGADVTAAFVAGARQAALLARAHGVRVAVLKEGSPSCGSGYVYDGSFSGTRVESVGITAAALQDAGVRVFSEHTIDAAAEYLEHLDREAAGELRPADGDTDMSRRPSGNPAAPVPTTLRSHRAGCVGPHGHAGPTVTRPRKESDVNDDYQDDVDIRLWSDDDLPLLERLMGDPAMTAYLGGPEAAEKIRERHGRYLHPEHSGRGRMFAIIVGPHGVAAGSVGFWAREWRGHHVWETGWSVLPEFQGRGVATRATVAVLKRARAAGTHRFIHAFPSVDNAVSNSICRKAGFILQGVVDVEYPKGALMRCNDWRLDLLDGSPQVSAS